MFSLSILECDVLGSPVYSFEYLLSFVGIQLTFVPRIIVSCIAIVIFSHMKHTQHFRVLVPEDAADEKVFSGSPKYGPGNLLGQNFGIDPK